MALTLVAACSSSGSSKSSDSAASGSSNGATSTSSGGSASSAQAAAAAVIAPYLKQPTSIGVDAPLPKTVKGKTFAYIQCGTPECVQTGIQMAEASAALGANYIRIDAGTTPQSFAAAFSVAVQKKPDVVLEAGIDPVVATSQVAQLAAAHIPILAWAIPEKAGNGITANLLPQTEIETQGRLMADYALAKSAKTVHAVEFTATEFTVMGPQVDAIKSEITSKCSSCTATIVKASLADIGTVVPGRVVSYLQQHPNTNVITFSFGSLLTGVPEALKAAGLGKNVLIISQAGGAPNWQYIRNGQQTADLGLDLHYFGWKAIDAAARVSTGSSLAPDLHPTPVEFLNKSTLTFSGTNFVAIPDYKQQFKKLWNVS